MSASSAWSWLTAETSPGATSSLPAIFSITTGANFFAATPSKRSPGLPTARLPRAKTPPNSFAALTAAKPRKPSLVSIAGAKSRKASSPKSSSTPFSPSPSLFTACFCIAPADLVYWAATSGARYFVPLLCLSHDAAIRRFFKQLLHSLFQTWIYRLRRNLRQRDQYEPPQMHPRMRHLQFRRADRLRPVKQDVDVHQPRPFRHQLLASHLRFDFAQSSQ